MAKKRWDESKVTRDESGRFVSSAQDFMPRDLFDPRTTPTNPPRNQFDPRTTPSRPPQNLFDPRTTPSRPPQNLFDPRQSSAKPRKPRKSRYA